MSTAADHARLLHGLADYIDPRVSATIDTKHLAAASDELREAAAHLEHIATGGDATASAEGHSTR